MPNATMLSPYSPLAHPINKSLLPLELVEEPYPKFALSTVPTFPSHLEDAHPSSTPPTHAMPYTSSPLRRQRMLWKSPEHSKPLQTCPSLPRQCVGTSRLLA